MFRTLVCNDQKSFFLHYFQIVILHVLFCVCEISIHCFIIELQYNHVLTHNLQTQATGNIYNKEMSLFIYRAETEGGSGTMIYIVQCLTVINRHDVCLFV